MVEQRARAGLFAGDVNEYVADVIEKVRLGRSSEECDQTANGRFIRVVKQPIVGSGWVETFEDITARRQAEMERDRNREFLDRVLDNVPVTIVVKDAAYRRYLQRYAPEVTTRQIEACFRELARTHRRGFSKPRFSGLEHVDAKES